MKERRKQSRKEMKQKNRTEEERITEKRRK